MTVDIKDNTQAIVENGTATFDATVGAWRYVTTVDVSSKPSVTVTVLTQDRPGNTGTKSATA